jgi:protein-disulfide isomerase
MPKKKRRSFSRQRASARNFQRQLLIGIAIVAAVVVVVVVVAGRFTTVGKSFPPREAGNPDAQVIVEEFSDYQCPFCGLFARTAEIRLRENYIKPGKILFIFHNLTVVDSYVPNGTESYLAAMGALCAGDQDMFWEYHDILYQNQVGENQGNFNATRLQSFAAELQLNIVEFNQCMSNQDHADIISDDTLLADARGVTGTPTFLVNGVQASGNSADFQWLFDAIDRALLTVGG